MPGKNKHLTYDDIVRVLFSIARDEWIVRMRFFRLRCGVICPSCSTEILFTSSLISETRTVISICYCQR